MEKTVEPLNYVVEKDCQYFQSGQALEVCEFRLDDTVGFEISFTTCTPWTFLFSALLAPLLLAAYGPLSPHSSQSRLATKHQRKWVSAATGTWGVYFRPHLLTHSADQRQILAP